MEEWLLWEFPAKVRDGATTFFFWSGVAIWVGLAARFLVPARVVRGPWLTLCLGFVGSCLGPFALRSFFKLDGYDPIGPSGLLASVFAALAALCLFYVVAFFFPARFDDEDGDRRDFEDDENDLDDEESAEFADERERARNERRRREYREPPRRRERVDDIYRERERDRRRDYDLDDEENDEREREAERRRRPRRR
ncbi:MAG: hypothetical protein IKU86_09320 [Thermoguttaceae bacterium]|nr:hypothetical protein [Thermoguttaceae bacterium]